MKKIETISCDKSKSSIIERNQDENRIRRYNRILEGINLIFSKVVQSKTEEELGNACLSVALELTGSQIGFVDELGTDGRLNDIAISDMGWEQCFMYDKIGHRRSLGNFIVHGLYGCVITTGKGFFTNDPQSHPDSIGLPSGHPSLNSFLGVPLIEEGKVVGMLAVANREGGYSSEQQEDLEAIAPAVTQVLHRKKEEKERKQAEEALKKAYDSLEAKVKERTAELEKAYNSLKESEECLAEAQKIAHIGNWDWDIVVDKMYRSDELYHIFRLDLQEFDTTYGILLNYVHPDDRERIDIEVKEALNGKPIDNNYRIILADGEERIVHMNGEVIFDEKNRPVRMRGTVQDITECKRAEEWTTYLASYPELNPNPIFEVGSDGMIGYINPAAKKIFPDLTTWGIDHTILVEFRKIFDWFKGDKLSLVRDVKFNDSFYQQDIHFVSDRKIVRFYNLDITERKRDEESLRKQAALIDLSPDAIIVRHLDGTINFWSKGAQSLYGWTSQEAIGQVTHTLLKTRFPQPLEQINKHIQQTGLWSGELIHCTKDDRRVIVQSQWQAEFDDQGNVKDMLESNVDITERKKAEEEREQLLDAIQQEKDRLAALINSVTDEVWFADTHKKLTLINPSAMCAFNICAEEEIEVEKLAASLEVYRPDGSLRPVEEAPPLIALRGEVVKDQEEIVRMPVHGELRYRLVSAAPVRDTRGNIIGSVSVVRDITESKKAEEKLRESEEKYRNIVETANEGILIIDDEARVTYANQKMTKMLGYTLEEGISRSIYDFLNEEYKAIVKLNLEKRRQGISGSYELKLIRKDGSSLWAIVNAKPLFDNDGKFVGSMIMLTDITARKKAEDALTKIEIARKQEIHHRIKNNLQVISSLLDLEAEKFTNRECIKDSEVLEAFKESQDRVISMALIHEELHKGGEIDTLNFSHYVEELTDNLFLTYRLGNDSIDLGTDIEEDIFFDMDTSVPLGMIINELVSNSLKYAFPDRDKGEIRIKLHREKEGEYKDDCNTTFVLTVSDNGVGIPEDIEIEDLDSLGLQLVTSLVDQLDGKLELKRNNGTEFTIRFTVAEKDSQAPAPAPQLADNE